MEKKRNIIVGQSGGPTSVINSSLAGVYKIIIKKGVSDRLNRYMMGMLQEVVSDIQYICINIFVYLYR